MSKEEILFRLKEKHARAVDTIKKGEGRLEALYKQLKADFNCPSIVKATKEIMETEKRIKKNKQRLNKLLKQFDRNYDV